MIEKNLVVVFSDPGTDEALGRLLNALFLVYDLKQRKTDVALLFQGAGVRWAGHLTRADHAAHGIYELVKDHVRGVCGGCADAFGATDEVNAAGLKLVSDLNIPGTSGIESLAKFIADGYRITIF